MHNELKFKIQPKQREMKNFQITNLKIKDIIISIIHTKKEQIDQYWRPMM